MTPKARMTSLKKQFRWKYPWKVEKELSNELRKHYSEIVNKVNSLFDKFEERIKNDSPYSELVLELLKYEELIDGEFADDKVFGVAVKSLADKYFSETYTFTEEEKDRFTALFGAGVVPSSKEMFAALLIALQTELKEKNTYWYKDYFKRVGKLIQKYNNGEITVGKFLKSVAVLGQTFAKSIPNGIARDSVGTLNSKFQRIMFTALGIREYIWQTAQDERVRGTPGGLYPNSDPSHYIMEGLICRWDNDFVFSNDGVNWQSRYGKMEKAAPGEAWNCRCVASPYMGNILKDVDRRI